MWKIQFGCEEKETRVKKTDNIELIDDCDKCSEVDSKSFKKRLLIGSKKPFKNSSLKY